MLFQILDLLALGYLSPVFDTTMLTEQQLTPVLYDCLCDTTIIHKVWSTI